LKVEDIPSSLSVSTAPYTGNIVFTGAGMSSITKVDWTCKMPNGNLCPGSPYSWEASDLTRKANLEDKKTKLFAWKEVKEHLKNIR
jgi:hypothetical protein